MKNSDKQWEKYGSKDPYFGVLSSDKYRINNLNNDAYLDFFKSGDEDLKIIISNIKKYLDASFEPRQSLDFGCGVGRILIPLAKNSLHVVGLDISESMLAEAQRNCELNHLQNIELIKSDDEFSGIAEKKFNFMHSFIVFQHISPKRGEKILQNMLNHLESHGVGVLHFTYYREASPLEKFKEWVNRYIPFVHNLKNLFKGKAFDYPLMQMNQYDLNRLFLILQKRNIHKIYIEMSNHGGYMGVILYFQMI
jgi:ubiquinone/menaquinone biosynthesis C-methylase UbiE